MASGSATSTLLSQRKRLMRRISEQQEELTALERVFQSLTDQLSRDEYMLGEIDSALGHSPQLGLEEANLRLRGQKLEQVAVEVLQEERGGDAEVHYKEWFQLLRERGYMIAGKEPLNTFLAQIGRSAAVERIGRRTGRYRLAKVA